MAHHVRADLTGIVLAGGRSRRLGTDKALLDVGGVPLIRRVLDVLAVCCAEVLVVAKDPAAYAGLGVQTIADRFPEQAALVGVITGLRAARTSYAFVAACDLPFLSPDVATWMAALAPGYDAVVPRVDGRWHPLHAVYAARVRGALEAEWSAGVRRMSEALRRLRVCALGADDLAAVNPGLRTLRNVNTHDEYQMLLRDLAGESPDKEGSAPVTNKSADET